MSLRGVFWDVDGCLYAFPFKDNYLEIGVAKSGNTYAHKKLWTEIKPKGCRLPYNYYPRGRVEVTSKGKALIYMNPYVDESLLPEIKKTFEMNDSYRIIYDNSFHYKCHMDNDWKSDYSK